MQAATTRPSPFGHALRRWRTDRGLSQLALSLRAETPARHISFLETGRARPTQPMVLRVAEALEIPLNDRNELLAAAGFAPIYSTESLGDEALQPVRFVIDRLLASHAPYPALVLDRWYDILDANFTAQQVFLGGIAPDPDDPPNLISLIIGPARAALMNPSEVIHDGLRRLRKDVRLSPGDARLEGLLETLEAATRDLPPPEPGPLAPVLFTRLRVGEEILSTLSTLVHFGGVHDVTVDGLHLELIYPADAATDAAFKAIGQAGKLLVF